MIYMKTLPKSTILKWDVICVKLEKSPLVLSKGERAITITLNKGSELAF